MSRSRLTRDTRVLSGLIIGLTVLGIILLLANLPGSPLRSTGLELFAIFVLPLVISLLAYVRFADPAVWWEIALLAVWGVLTIVVTAFIGFLATMEAPVGYPGAGGELLQDIAMFLAVTLGLGVPYGFAGTFRRDRPRRSVVIALLSSVVLFILSHTVAVGL